MPGGVPDPLGIFQRERQRAKRTKAVLVWPKRIWLQRYQKLFDEVLDWDPSAPTKRLFRSLLQSPEEQEEELGSPGTHAEEL